MYNFKLLYVIEVKKYKAKKYKAKKNRLNQNICEIIVSLSNCGIIINFVFNAYFNNIGVKIYNSKYDAKEHPLFMKLIRCFGWIRTSSV